MMLIVKDSGSRSFVLKTTLFVLQKAENVKKKKNYHHNAEIKVWSWIVDYDPEERM